ncbi:neuroblast differentiation-associated AHNAK-like [Solea senegalensis]|uniref:Neuroblast differentiation-associated AHNAK-like n=1 Tax=Solea senegalensis TaxID=28829 RepID=A0AAV6RWW8_SOLSE|nr:neuroblast differentiation-associated AHNAK-like [Solea senegalensis]
MTDLMSSCPHVLTSSQVCDEPPQFTEGERPRPQGSSPVEEFPETDKYTDSDKECDTEHDPRHKSGTGKKRKKSGLGSMFEKRSTPKMSKLKEHPSPESGVIVKTAKDGCAEGLIYGGGGKEGIFIKEVIPESPASKSLKLREGDQVLSATVYFDNVPYEDAIQILEHAQAYNVKLCLKRKPDISETEPAMDSDVIPEDEVCAPEMREQGKTKRRGDARISWPKFPSFGKGPKSRFTRSHSSSEADEQRKLELSPTTSDTESPIKSQDALKGKKRHKMKLSVLTKRGRISSSEDQDTEAPTTGQTSDDIHQTASDMLSPECIESLSGQIPEVFVTEDVRVVEEIRLEQSDQIMTDPVQHKVELISIDSTLKTEDLTMALADQGSSPPGIKSPKEKKSKKERSQLKMKILGKEKSHKKDAKAKGSPKRLKTLGASIEAADQPGNETSDAIPGSESQTQLQGDNLLLDINTSDESQLAKSAIPQKEMSIPTVDFDISSTFMRKSQKQEQAKKDDIKQKQEIKTCPTFKLPKLGFSDISTEETVQTVNVEERPTKMKRKSEDPAVKDDPYDILSKSSQLPKREDIEIPGMEDMAVRTNAKGIKEPKVGSRGHHEEMKADAVQMLIDVNSVKEAVSKLPGFKLPKVDTSGVPIPEEITVIDANAQRISVKTPTKVADTKSKYGGHLMKVDITASPEIKLPKITPVASTSEDLLIETKVDFKTPEKVYKTEVYKREDIIIPGKESEQGTVGITFENQSAAMSSPKESSKKSSNLKITTASFKIAPVIQVPEIGGDFTKQNNFQEGDALLGRRTIVLQGETPKISDVKMPDIDSIEYIDSVSGSPAQMGAGINLTGFGVHLDATKPKTDIEAEVKLPDAPEVNATLESTDVSIPEEKLKVEKPELEIKPLQTEVEFDLQRSKFKMPKFGIKMPKMKGPQSDISMSKKDMHVTLPEGKAVVKLPDAPDVDVTLGSIDVSIPEQKLEVEKPELEIKPLQTDIELDGQGSKFKMPKFGIKMPKMKGPQLDISLPKKDMDITIPEAEVKLSNAPEVDINLGSVDVSIPEQKLQIEKTELELKQAEVEFDGQFKMRKIGMSMPKVKGPEIDFNMSKKDMDIQFPEAKAEIKLPDVELKEPSTEVEFNAPEIEAQLGSMKESPSKFKLPTFKFPKFGIATPDVSDEAPDKDIKVEATIPEVPEIDVSLGKAEVLIPEGKLEVQKLEMEIKPLKSEGEFDGQGVKGPEIDISLSKKDVDIKLPEAKAEVSLPDVELKDPSAKVEVKSPEIEAQLGSMKGSSSKFKLPTFKLPKFGFAAPDVSAKVPDTDKDIKVEVKIPDVPEIDVNLGKAEVLIPEGKLEVQKPEVEIKPLQTEVELDGQGGKFKMPKLGVSMPKVKGPEIDLSISKKDADIKLPEAKVEVNLPDVELKQPSAKVEVQAPEIEAQFDSMKGSPSKFKLPTFKLPKFGVAAPDVSAKVPDTDKDIKVEVKIPDVPEIDVNLGKAEVLLPEGKLEVQKPEVEIKPLQTEIELDGQGGKFKMPKLGVSMPKIKGPEVDISISKKDADIKLPEAKVEINLPDVELKQPSAKVEVQAPEIEAQLGSMKGSPSKFKLPTFKFPKFGVAAPDVSAKVPDTDKDIKVEVKIPDVPEIDVNLGKAEVLIPEGNIEVQKPEVEIKPLQMEVELDGQGSKFKMPKLGMSMPKVKGPEIDISISKKDADIKLPKVEGDFSLPDVELKELSAKGEVQAPEIEAQLGSMKGSPSKFKLPTFKFPKFGVAAPDVSAKVPDTDKDIKVEVKIPDVPEIDVNLGEAEVLIPEGNIDVQKPEVEIKPLQMKVELDGQGSKFKMPKLGMSMPKVKGPEIDISISKKDADIKLPKVEGDFSLPDVELKEPSAKVEVQAPEIEAQLGSMKGSPSKFKLPTFKFPKFGVATPDVSAKVPDTDKDIKVEVKIPDVPEIDVNLGKAEVLIPEGKLEVQKPEVKIKSLQTEVELDGQGGKFKMPKLGMSIPKVKGPEIDISISKKDADIKLPKVEGELNLPDIEIKEPSAKVEVEAPEIEAQLGSMKGSPSKFKLPTFKFPKFGVAAPDVSAKVPDTDKDIKVEVKIPDVPEIDVNLGKAEVLIPEGNIEVQKPEVEIKPLQMEELDGQGSKFKMPKLGMSMPKVKGPEIDISISKKDADIKLPKVEGDFSLPDVELKEPSAKVEVQAPEIEAQLGSMKGSPSKFKLPTFKFPKFGVATPDVSAKVPDTDKDIKVEVKIPDVPEIDVNLGKAEVLIPEGKLEVQKPEVKIKSLQTEVELDGQGGKFKMPKLGMSIPKVKGPEIDISISKKDADIKLPKVEGELNLPDIEIKEPSAKVEVEAPEIEAQLGSMKGSPSKFKLPTFKFPKFGVAAPDVSAKVPDTGKDIKVEVKIPDVTEIDVNLGKAEVLIPEGKLEVQKPEVQIKPLQTEVELDGQGSKFKMPKLGMSMPKIKGPEIDISISKKDVDIKLPETEAEVSLPDIELKQPSAKAEVQAPEIEAQLGSMKGSPSKFKLPTFKFPKFGVAAPDVSAKVPDTDKDIKVEVKIPDVPEIDVNLGKAEVLIPEGKIEVQKPEVEIKPLQMEVELDGQGSKFKMPKLGMSMPKIKGPEIDISISKRDADIKLPKVEGDFSLPDVELKEPSAKVEVQAPEIEAQLGSMKGSPSKFKLPTFKFPKFGVAAPDVSAKVPDTDKDIKVEVKIPDVPKIDVKAEVLIPEGMLKVQKPEVEIKPLQTEVELDGQGSKFKMPKLGVSMPKIKGPEVDISISKNDADIKLPETEAEVSLPDIELKQSSAKVEVQAPEIEAQLGSMKGSQSKFKLPTFKFPKFGVAAADVSAKVPDTDKDIKVEARIPEVPEINVHTGKAEVLIPEGKLEVQKPEVEIKPLQTEVELDGQGSKFKMPKLGMSMPKIKGPEIDISISKKDAEIKLPETEAEVSLTDIELKEPSAKVEVQAPEIEAQLGSMKGSPSKFKLPTFKFPKFGVAAPDVSAKVPDTDKDIKVEVKIPDVPEIDVNLGKAEVLIPEGKLEVQKPEVEIKPLQMEVELDGQGGKFKMPKIGMSMPKVEGPEIDISISKKDTDIKLPKVEAEVNLPDVELKEPSAKVDVQAPEIEAQLGSMKGSPSKFKLPTFKFPKFGVAAPDVSAKVPDSHKDIKVEVKIPDVPEIDVHLGKAEVLIPEGKIEVQKPEVEIKPLQMEVELDGQGGKFKMPKIGMSMPKKDVDIKLPKVEAEVSLPDVKLKESSAQVEVQAPGMEAQLGSMKGSPSKFKLPTFKFPKFGHATSDVSGEVPDTDKDIKVDVKIPEVPEIDVKLGKAEVLIPEANMEVQIPEMVMKPLQTEGEHDGQGSKFKMPKFGIKKPKLKGPELDVSLPKKDIDVTLQEAKAEVSLPDAPEVDVTLGGIDIQIPQQKLEFEKPDLEIKPRQSEIELDGQGRKFKMPKLGMSMPKVKGPEIDISISKQDADIKLPEGKAEVSVVTDVDLREPSAKIEVTAPEIEPQLGSVKESPSKFKLPTFKFPKFGTASPNVSAEVPDTDEEIKIDGARMHISAPHTTVDVPEVKASVTLPDIEVKEPSADIVIVQQPGIEVDAKVKKPRFSLPKFSFSKTSVKATEVVSPDFDVPLPEGNMEIVPPEIELKPTGADGELEGQESKFKIPKSGISVPKLKGPDIDLSLSTKDIDVTLPKAEEGEVIVKQPEMEIKSPELESQQGSKFKIPKFGIALPKAKGPEVDLTTSQKDADITLPDVKAEVKLPEVDVKESSTSVETEAKSKDVGGSPLKFKMPTLKMPKFGSATHDVTVEAPDADKAEISSAKLEEDIAVKISGPSVDVTAVDSETPKTDTDDIDHGSPSRFKLPSFKMPRLSFSRPKPEEENVPTEVKEDQLETARETKSPKMTLTSFGEMLKNFDVEFDVSQPDKEEGENLGTRDPSGDQLDEKDTDTKQGAAKTPEKTSWFKFPRFGLSSPSEPVKTFEKDEQRDEKSPVGETGAEETSPTCSVQSSDAFADISSTVTSEHVGVSISSPTKVTVKYSDPNGATELEEIHSKVITSTTKTEMISVEPDLPEKITILSSGVSSSSEDTVKLESGIIHIISSNIQATPEAQHAKLFSAVQVQSAGGLALEPEAGEAASWTVEDSQSGRRTVFERHVVRETSSERSESKETIVITKQVTHIFDSSEPISGETASSIQRLRDTVHSEKMRFFDGAEK